MVLFSSVGKKSPFIIGKAAAVLWSLPRPGIKWPSLNYSCLCYFELQQKTQLSVLALFQAVPYSWEHCSGSSVVFSVDSMLYLCSTLWLLPVVECWIKCGFLVLLFEVLEHLKIYAGHKSDWWSSAVKSAVSHPTLQTQWSLSRLSCAQGSCVQGLPNTRGPSHKDPLQAQPSCESPRLKHEHMKRSSHLQCSVQRAFQKGSEDETLSRTSAFHYSSIFRWSENHHLCQKSSEIHWARSTRSHPLVPSSDLAYGQTLWQVATGFKHELAESKTLKMREINSYGSYRTGTGIWNRRIKVTAVWA